MKPVLPCSTYSTREGTLDTMTGLENVYARGTTPLTDDWKVLLYGKTRNDDLLTMSRISGFVMYLPIIVTYP